MKYNLSVTCPNEDCEADIEVTEFEPYDPGLCSGPPERCYPPEGGTCYGGDTCPKCGAVLSDKFWEDAFEDLERTVMEREHDG